MSEILRREFLSLRCRCLVGETSLAVRIKEWQLYFPAIQFGHQLGLSVITDLKYVNSTQQTLCKGTRKWIFSYNSRCTNNKQKINIVLFYLSVKFVFHNIAFALPFFVFSLGWKCIPFEIMINYWNCFKRKRGKAFFIKCVSSF